MTEVQETLQVAQKWFTSINAHDFTCVAKLVDDDFMWEIGEVVIAGCDAAEQIWQQLWCGFPDLHLEVEQMLGSGEFVVARWQLSGTHRGELRFCAISSAEWKGQLRSFVPTDRRVRVRGCTVFQVTEGKIVRGWDYWDTLSLLRQLGIS